MIDQLPTYIWHFRGREKNGPKILILGGTHGDELGGIATVRLLLKRLGALKKQPGKYENELVKGDLFVGFGNPEAMLRGTRSASDGWDLNRSFTESELARPPHETDRLDLIRARELEPLLKEVDVLFDLHNSSSLSEPFVCVGTKGEKHEAVFGRLPVRYILSDPNHVYENFEGGDGPATADQCVDRQGGAGVSYEVGWAKDESVAEQILANVLELLIGLGALAEAVRALARRQPTPIPNQQTVFAFRAVIVSEKEGFIYEKGMDKGWLEVKEGQILGRYADGTEVVIPKTGRLVFPSAPHICKPGNYIAWIAEPERK